MDYSKLFDSHSHFHREMCEGQAFVLSGYSSKSNFEAMEKVLEQDKAYLSLGLGPQEIQREDLHPDLNSGIFEVEQQIESALLDSKLKKRFVAIGEVGLDSHWGKTPGHKLRQFEAFTQMISLAKKHSLPLVIHSRDAEKECIQQLLASNCKKVMMHCFGGSLEQAKICAGAGYFISIPPVRHKERKKIIREIDLEHLLVESDAPYLGKKSTDAYESAKMIAEYKDAPLDAVLEQTFENAKKLFGI